MAYFLWITITHKYNIFTRVDFCAQNDRQQRNNLSFSVILSIGKFNKFLKRNLLASIYTYTNINFSRSLRAISYTKKEIIETFPTSLAAKWLRKNFLNCFFAPNGSKLEVLKRKTKEAKWSGYYLSISPVPADVHQNFSLWQILF